ncbi:hypothetical protein LAZ67_21000474 [Cordylochernes scorpioides]|uniref:alkaline phosphatase n=1 Tax=Cordylochernes scorpioides TaxID=51811 RepID=A0ABY6LPC8_9ARAC|nr:hypothetical protein LAZ67_21000474 [Cordylochernes scorpioides]
MHTSDTQKYWETNSLNALKTRLSQQQPNTNRARNTIFFLGDGMSVTTQTAARILKGQLAGRSGEEGELDWEAFPHTSRSKTYSLDKQVGDSAATASAYLTGVKGNQGTIGVNGKVKRGDCKAQMNPDNHLTSIMAKAQRMGMSTGVVTTTRITHASPAGAYAHIAERNWEGKSPSATDCPDIATQLIRDSPGNKLNVILGGGLQMFLPKGSHGSKRKDNSDLLKEYKNLKNSTKHAIVKTKEQLEAAAATEDIQYVLGLFSNSHLAYILDKSPNSTEPTLAEMTSAAIKILQRNPRGYILFVEGGRIDHAHHATLGKKALHETLEMEKAVAEAHEHTDPSETLILVTADHSHTVTMSGYPERGNDILGFAGISLNNTLYTTLHYANGPGVDPTSRNLTMMEVTANNYTQSAGVPLAYETHSGEDVSVHATGPWSHLYSGVHEQTYIPTVISYAACLSDIVAPHCGLTYNGAPRGVGLELLYEYRYTC